MRVAIGLVCLGLAGIAACGFAGAAGMNVPRTCWLDVAVVVLAVIGWACAFTAYWRTQS